MSVMCETLAHVMYQLLFTVLFANIITLKFCTTTSVRFNRSFRYFVDIWPIVLLLLYFDEKPAKVVDMSASNY